MATNILNIPEGIRFDCSGCGNCCLGWPVPLTAADVSRLDSSMIRPLHIDDSRLKVFTHSLEKTSDGRCAHLTEFNRCGIHEQHGAAAKPSMCQLFPYSFTETPDGLFAYVSFASSAVLHNVGQPLSQQRDLLLEKWQEFEKLFPDRNKDWSTLQILDGYALSWHEYSLVEKKMLEILVDKTKRTSLERLTACSEIVVKNLPGTVDVEQLPALEAEPAIVDQLILKHLFKLYLPAEVFADTNMDLSARDLLTELVSAPNSVALPHAGGEISFLTLDQYRSEPLPEDAQELIKRFIYCRLFAKMYFGPGYAHLSLLTGIHHLYFLVAIIELAAKLILMHKGSMEFNDIVEIVRKAERRLTQVNLCPESCAVLEVLLRSPARLQRIAKMLR